MLVATFNATTGWAGRQITWQDDRLILDGHGPITAADLMAYDGQGQLDWPSEEMRSWAAARLSWEQAVAQPAFSTPATPVTAEAVVVPATPVTPMTPVTPVSPVTAAVPTTPITPTTEAHRPFSAQTAVVEPATDDEPFVDEPAAAAKPNDDSADDSVAADEEPASPETAAAFETQQEAEVAPETSAPETLPEAEAAPVADATTGAEAAVPPSDEVYDVLAPGGDIAELVGTAPYQETLEAIAGDKPESAPELEKWAHLIPEPDNPWDRNAVAVYIDARKIGYLPRESSPAYAALLTQLWVTSRARAVCRAVVTGGSYKVTTQAGSVAEVDEEQFGVKLALAAPQHFDVTRGLRHLTAEELADGPPHI